MNWRVTRRGSSLTLCGQACRPRPAHMARREEPKKRPLTKIASSVLAWVDQNPIPKLLAIAWVVSMSLWSPYDAYRRSHLGAERSGLTYEPATILMLTANNATLVN